MGNKCGCCSSGNKQKKGIFGSKQPQSKKNKQGESVLPADLHASSGHSHNNIGSGSAAVPIDRPGTLEIQGRDGTGSNFPAFPLHGVQKSSPIIASGNQTPVSSLVYDETKVKHIEELYETYRDSTSDEDLILADGVEQFCQDLDVDPADFIVLVLAWKFNAETMCKFTRKEFVDGFTRLQCHSIANLRSAFKRIELDAMNNFKDLYRYTFQFSLDAEEGQRSLPCDIAVAMWNIVFSRNPPAILQSWFTFLQERNIRGISRDTWNMFLYLTESLNEDLSNYNDSEAWPSLFDDFVDYKREEFRNKQNKPEDGIATLEETRAEIDEFSIDNFEDGNTVSKPDIPGAILTSEESIEAVDHGEPGAPLPSKTCEPDKQTMELTELMPTDTNVSVM